MHIQIDRYIDRKIDRQIDAQKDRKRDRYIDIFEQNVQFLRQMDKKKLLEIKNYIYFSCNTKFVQFQRTNEIPLVIKQIFNCS